MSTVNATEVADLPIGSIVAPTGETIAFVTISRGTMALGAMIPENPADRDCMAGEPICNCGAIFDLVALGSGKIPHPSTVRKKTVAWWEARQRADKRISVIVSDVPSEGNGYMWAMKSPSGVIHIAAGIGAPDPASVKVGTLGHVAYRSTSSRGGYVWVG